ncbi:MAG: hypothetical protein ACK5E7_05035 [Cyclobacteriaceae bacterium]
MRERSGKSTEAEWLQMTKGQRDLQELEKKQTPKGQLARAKQKRKLKKNVIAFRR